MGVLLAFAGRAIWGRMMTVVGLVLGGTVGYDLGALLIPGVGALALALVGAMLGGMVFTWLVEVALAGMAGILGLYVSYRALLGVLTPNDALVAGLLVLLVIFSAVFYYMHRILSYVTALVGAVLAAVGLFLLTNDLGMSVGAAVGFVVGGSLVQEFVVKPYEVRRRERPGKTGTVPPPPPE